VNESLRSRLAAQLALVEQRLAAACRRAGRARADVTLVAVTKTVSVEVAALLPELGVHDLGESRPQELWRKAAALPRLAPEARPVRWHAIGHLQRNKLERTLPLVCCIHSVDSLRLLTALDEEAQRQGREVPVLLEVNASGEPSKHGFSPAAAPGLADAIAGLKRLRVAGLMTMAAPEEDPQRCRPTFILLRSLRDQLRQRLGDGQALPHLSMGMSNDFEVAIEEGATMVRLGSVLFEGVVSGP
jgi:pyridoxal phosphate enzyme (YggS family)